MILQHKSAWVISFCTKLKETFVKCNFILYKTQRNLCQVGSYYITDENEFSHIRDVEAFILTVGVVAGDGFGAWYSHMENRCVGIEPAVRHNQRLVWWMQEQFGIHD